MTRISDKKFELRVAAAVARIVTTKPPKPRARYRAERDATTGVTTMVPVEIRVWGESGDSPAVIAAVGPMRYDRLADEDYEVGKDFAEIALVRSSQFLAGHVDEERFGRFARDYVTLARALADGDIREDVCLVLDFVTSDKGRKLTHVMEMNCEAVAISLFDSVTGVHFVPPVSFYYDDGALGQEVLDFSLTLEKARVEDELTHEMLDEYRLEMEPATILDLESFRMARAAG